MSASRTARRLLACYPPAWRERYGEELAELIVLTAGDGPVRWSTRLDVLRTAARERGRSVIGAGRAGDPERRVREGIATVLCAWTAFALAGVVVAKTSEHWNDVLGDRIPAVATVGFDVLRIAAMVTAALVVCGILLALPATWDLVRREGLLHRRSQIVRAYALSIAAVGATAGLSSWGGHLSAAQRNGHDTLYALGFIAWALLGAAALIACTAAALDTAARLRPLGPRIRRLQTVLAGLAATGMAVITAGVLVWWIAVALRAPAALVGATGSGSPWVPELIAAALVMVGGATTAGVGAARALSTAPAHR
jgi:hypothetical protein